MLMDSNSNLIFYLILGFDFNKKKLSLNINYFRQGQFYKRLVKDFFYKMIIKLILMKT